MKTSFVALALPLPATVAAIHPAIETALKVYGLPLRWSITHIQQTESENIAHIEAIVTTN